MLELSVIRMIMKNKVIVFSPLSTSKLYNNSKENQREGGVQRSEKFRRT